MPGQAAAQGGQLQSAVRRGEAEHLKIIEYEARLKSGVERVAIRTAIQQMPRSFYPSFLSLADFDFRVEDLPFIK